MNFVRPSLPRCSRPVAPSRCQCISFRRPGPAYNEESQAPSSHKMLDVSHSECPCSLFKNCFFNVFVLLPDLLWNTNPAGVFNDCGSSSSLACASMAPKKPRSSKSSMRIFSRRLLSLFGHKRLLSFWCSFSGSGGALKRPCKFVYYPEGQKMGNMPFSWCPILQTCSGTRSGCFLPTGS